MTHKSSSSGHRGRLIERFSQAGLKGLHDYEILELLLTLVIPRKDTKDLAKTLLARYKQISAVLAANQRELESFDSLGERSVTLLKFVRELSSYCLQETYYKKEIISSQKDVEEYLRFHFSHLRNEYAVVLFLDNGNRVLSTEILAEGSVDHCTVYPRKIFDYAFKVGAAGVILAHNHPGGSRIASSADWKITERIFLAGKLLDIALLDHILVTDSGVVSLRADSRWPQ